MQCSQIRGEDAEEPERCCGSTGGTIQIRNPHKQHRGRNRTSCSRVLLPLSSPSPPPGCALLQAGVRDRSLRAEPLCSLGLLQGMPSQPASPPCNPKRAVRVRLPGNFSLLRITTDRSGMGRAGLELPHVTAACRQGGDFATPDSHRSSPYLCRRPARDSSCQCPGHRQ